MQLEPRLAQAIIIRQVMTYNRSVEQECFEIPQGSRQAFEHGSLLFLADDKIPGFWREEIEQCYTQGLQMLTHSSNWNKDLAIPLKQVCLVNVEMISLSLFGVKIRIRE